MEFIGTDKNKNNFYGAELILSGGFNISPRISNKALSNCVSDEVKGSSAEHISSKLPSVTSLPSMSTFTPVGESNASDSCSN